MQLFLAQLEPLWSVERMAADHAALVRGLERDGPAVLREHLGESAAALVAAEAGVSARTARVGEPPARYGGGEVAPGRETYGAPTDWIPSSDGEKQGDQTPVRFSTEAIRRERLSSLSASTRHEETR